MMKARIQLALMGCLASIAAHIYLTLHYYPIKFGYSGGQSLCNLNAKFDCDAVAASAYSSLMGVPLSLWGAVTSAILFLMILLSWLQWSENPERFKRWTLALAGLNFGASIVMAVVSFTQMRNYCIVCLTIYALSALIFFAFKGLLQEPFWMHLRRDLRYMWSEAKGTLAAFLAIPVLSYLTHQMFMQNLGDIQIEQIVRESVQEWESAPIQNFVAKPTLSMGPTSENATMTLVEFADFRCSHCKHASYTLHAFVKAHPDVRFEFYVFPLDGECNEKIQVANGISCRLAAAVWCAEKENKGWEMHDSLFNLQEEVNRLSSPREVDPRLSQTVAQIGLNWERLQNCIIDPAVQDAVRAQAKQGGLVNVAGTPTMFVNGRLLSRAQIIPVLQAVYSKSLAAKVK